MTGVILTIYFVRKNEQKKKLPDNGGNGGGTTGGNGGNGGSTGGNTPPYVGPYCSTFNGFWAIPRENPSGNPCQTGVDLLLEFRGTWNAATSSWVGTITNGFDQSTGQSFTCEDRISQTNGLSACDLAGILPPPR